MDNFCEEMENEIYNLLNKNNLEEVAKHTKIVANTARQLASRFGLDEEAAYIAGLLHDIGNIIPVGQRVEFCNASHIVVLEEEKIAPALLHSRISAILARGIFGVNEEICSAIECHSTLKANAAKLDLALFVADKTSWESNYNKDFIDEMLMGLDTSLECAALAYVRYMCNSEVKVLHPMVVEAFHYLEGVCK